MSSICTGISLIKYSSYIRRSNANTIISDYKSLIIILIDSIYAYFSMFFGILYCIIQNLFYNKYPSFRTVRIMSSQPISLSFLRILVILTVSVLSSMKLFSSEDCKLIAVHHIQILISNHYFSCCRFIDCRNNI